MILVITEMRNHHKLQGAPLEGAPLQGAPLQGAPLQGAPCLLPLLSQDPDHVIVCHCKGGKGRTGVAIAAYIQYSNMCLSAEDCLDKFAMNR